MVDGDGFQGMAGDLGGDAALVEDFREGDSRQSFLGVTKTRSYP